MMSSTGNKKFGGVLKELQRNIIVALLTMPWTNRQLSSHLQKADILRETRCQVERYDRTIIIEK